jgi:hypothetical protein
MKLRLHSNSVRLRLTRSEVERLRDNGLVEESLGFGGGGVLAYRLLCRPEPCPVEAAYGHGVLTVSVSMETARVWAGSDEVGVYGQSGPVSISIEKDFRCLTQPIDDQERDAYPHPGERS